MNQQPWQKYPLPIHLHLTSLPESGTYFCFERGPDDRVRVWTESTGSAPDPDNERIACANDVYYFLDVKRNPDSLNTALDHDAVFFAG